VDLLTQLVDKSLVYVEKSVEHGARYFMLESIWDYAEEKLRAASEEDAFRQRHLDYFMDCAEQAAPLLIGPEQKEWLGRMELEDLNFRLAIKTSLELPGQVAKGLRLATAAQRLVEVRGLFKKAREHGAKLLAHPDAAPRDAIRAQALAAAGRLAWVADDMTATVALHSEALEIFRELGDARGTAQALADLSFHAFYEENLPLTTSLLDEASALAAQLNEPRLNAHIRHIRGMLAASAGDFATALTLEEEALALYRRLGDAWFVAIVAWATGVNLAVLGRYPAAHARLTESLRVSLDLGNVWGASYPIDSLAFLAVAERDYDRAARLFGAAEAHRLRSGLVPTVAEHPALRAILAAAPDFTGAAIDAAREEGRALALAAAIALATQPTQ
jgi:tetratricopeptide (TPR) repeat protein